MWTSKPNKSQFKSNFLSSFLGFVFQVNHRILGISILRSVVDPLIEWIETPWADFVINQLPACHTVIRIGNQTNPDSRTKLKSGDDYTFCAQCMDSSEPILQRFFVQKIRSNLHKMQEVVVCAKLNGAKFTVEDSLRCLFVGTFYSLPSQLLPELKLFPNWIPIKNRSTTTTNSTTNNTATTITNVTITITMSKDIPPITNVSEEA